MLRKKSGFRIKCNRVINISTDKNNNKIIRKLFYILKSATAERSLTFTKCFFSQINRKYNSINLNEIDIMYTLFSQS